MMPSDQPIRVIDSHTEGEPTRVVISGGPDLGRGPLSERLRRFRETADAFRRSIILEPRGSEALVGALLCEPTDHSCIAGVIFFNNAGYLGMCGHGMIGVAVTLNYLGRIGIGTHRVETPVGVVEVKVLEPNLVAIENVPSFRHLAQVGIEVESLGMVVGDVAWGGNWFFLVEQSPFPVTGNNIRRLTDAAEKIRRELARRGITGARNEVIDHVEFFGPPQSSDAHSRNFVICPGGAYDRSPCGTGTSAKLACLAEDGKLLPGELWIQESIIGSRFTASYRQASEGQITPTIIGHSFICGDAVLIQQPGDPFRDGISIEALPSGPMQ
jgi:4-hydroxyproline epimerase